ncbi:MAG TPA: BatA domain-containing protein [Planctomycetia bacterium]|nr:BatA domain-containing protein [Planctomycetia bacterium]
MSLTFQTGWLAFAGIMAGVVPVIIHLLLRQKPKTVVFPALRLLRTKQNTIVKKLRLRHLLLLALRIALLALLGAALARPTLKSAGIINVDQEAPVFAILILDTSPSMELKVNGVTRLEAAKEAAKQILEKFSEGSQIVVIDSATPTTHPPVEFAIALERANKLEISPAQQPLDRALDAALRALQKNKDALRCEVYVLTDLAAHAWSAGGETAGLKRTYEQIEGGASVYIVDLAAPKPRNLAVKTPLLAQQVMAANGVLEMKVQVANTGPELDTAIELLVDGQSRESRPVKLGADQSADFNFTVPGLTQGIHQGTVQVKSGDALAFDDARFFTVEVRPAVRTLVVAPAASEAWNWVRALEPEPQRPRFLIETLYDPAKLAEKNLQDYATVAILDAPGLPTAAWEKLKTYAEGGGGVFFGLGPRVDPLNYNSDVAQGVLPAKLVSEVATRGTPAFLSPDRRSHPILTTFLVLGRNNFGSGFVDRYWKVETQKGSSTVIPYTTGDPGIVERAFPGGKGGKSMLLTTAAHYQPTGFWSELPRTWSYLVLVEQIARYLAGMGEIQLNFPVGSQPLAELPAAPPDSVTMTDPKKETQNVTVEDSASGVLRLPLAKWPGNYALDSADKRRPWKSAISANVPDAESALEPADPEKLKTLLGNDRVAVAKDIDALERNVAKDRVGMDLFPLLILLTLIAVSVEGVISNRFYKRLEPAGTKAAA